MEWRKDGRGENWPRKNGRGHFVTRKIVARKIDRGGNWLLGNKIHFQFESVSN